MMKKLLIAGLILALLLALAACGGGENNPGTPDNPENPGGSSKTPDIPDTISESFLRSYPAAAEKDFETEEEGMGVKIMKYTGSSPVVVVPKTIGGKDVVAVAAYNVFANESPVRAVWLPDTVKELSNTFVNNESLEIVICEGVEICGDNAFFNCFKLHTLVFGNALKEIGKYGLSNCLVLKEVYIAPTMTSVTSSTAFYGSEALTIVGESGSFIEQYAQENNIPFKTK